MCNEAYSNRHTDRHINTKAHTYRGHGMKSSMEQVKKSCKEILYNTKLMDEM